MVCVCAYPRVDQCKRERDRGTAHVYQDITMLMVTAGSLRAGCMQDQAPRLLNDVAISSSTDKCLAVSITMASPWLTLGSIRRLRMEQAVKL